MTKSLSLSRFALTICVLAALGCAQRRGGGSSDRPLTVPEKSAWTKTSTHADVLAFVDALAKLPKGSLLHRVALGETTGGREMIAVVAGEAPDAVMSSGKLRAVINANIHGGEVEGKEIVQMMMREIAEGEHAELLEKVVVIFVPDFNADGNDEIAPRNRRGQNGPIQGAGQRPNGQGFDLNRDFLKARSPEVRAMLGLYERFDPHLFMDLHTTNGSYHGYHLTYAPSLAVNVDPALDRFVRQAWLPEVTKACRDTWGIRAFHYGNFPRRGRELTWSTYDHRPRFGTNYFGLRNRIAVLSEAFSYASFEKRAEATYAFVAENLRALARHGDAVRKLTAECDARADAGVAKFGYASQLEAGTERDILVGKSDRIATDGVEGARRTVMRWGYRTEKMRARIAFEPQAFVPLPVAWAVVNPSDEVRELLARHGLEMRSVERAVTVDGEVFVPRRAVRGRTFQGARPLSLEGDLRKEKRELPAGTIIVPAKQRLGRVAAQLLEAQSEDSLATWGLFDAQVSTEENGSEPTGRLHYPVIRLSSLEGLGG